MTTEKEIGSNNINIFVVSNDHSCKFYSALDLSNFPKIFRKLLIDNDISTYQEFVENINGAISLDTLQSYILEDKVPTSEDFLIIANYFKVSPEIFLEYRALQQKSNVKDKDIFELLELEDKSNKETISYEITESEIASLLMSEVELIELEKILGDSNV